jgi:enoyl-CoA hydratase/carnithine racemase
VATLTIRRPKVLNALNPEVYGQLQRHFAAIEKDPKIKATVLTGFGTKAFVSGADINFLAKIETPEQGETTSNGSKETAIAVLSLKKPVVCAVNGLAFGGGIELAMCCSALLVAKGLKVAVGQPEANLGIIPGAGGTQLLPRWVGVEKAAEMIRTCKPISSAEGAKIGLFKEEVEPTALVDRAIALARDLAAGKAKAAPVSKDPMKTPEKLPEVAIGHLSRAIDGIICRAILEGCRKPLLEGFLFESKMFGECVKTADFRIGLDNFVKNGPKAKASFKHS